MVLLLIVAGAIVFYRRRRDHGKVYRDDGQAGTGPDGKDQGGKAGDPANTTGISSQTKDRLKLESLSSSQDNDDEAGSNSGSDDEGSEEFAREFDGKKKS